MRKLFLLCLSIAFLSLHNSFAQPQFKTTNPLDYFIGEWVQKTTSIDPSPEGDDWKSQVVLNEFIPILNGNGLHRIASTDYNVVEGYFFYDSGVGKVYGMSIDPNGYVWQTESELDSQGNVKANKGGPLNDDSVRIESSIQPVNKNEFKFTQTIYEDGQKASVVKGVFIRIPGVDYEY